MESRDQIFMKRALELARNAWPNCRPNPAVGAVVVYNGSIVGEGFTQQYGGPHAEVMAIKAVEQQKVLKDSSLYVTLEPCNHYGKTPPCSELIIKSQIKEVFIATRDPFGASFDRGIEILEKNKVKVHLGICEEEALEINKRFFTFQGKKRPYLILKWAESKDRFIAPANSNDHQKIHWISGELSQQLNHKWRSEEMAILVGTNTAFSDNPELNTRHWNGKSPIRILIDKDLRIKESSRIFNDSADSYIFNDRYNSSRANLHWIKLNFDRNVPEQICSFLYELNIQSVIVEGGAITLNSFIEKGLWDEARIFRSKTNLGKGVEAPKLNAAYHCLTHIGKDELRIYKKKD